MSYLVNNIEVYSINFNLKSNNEKDIILKSYKNLLKSCDFNIQIIIYSQEENLFQHINFIKENFSNLSNKKLLINYINELKNLNSCNNSKIKKFYILISEKSISKNKEIIFNNLKNKYFKLKELLLKCGNNAKLIDDKKSVKNIIKYFFNMKGAEELK